MKNNAILFGSGSGAVTLLQNLEEDYLISAVTDNNPDKEGKEFNGMRIELPENVDFKSHDLVIVGSTYTEEIFAQLVNDLGVSPEKIYLPPKSFFKKNPKPFMDEATRGFAESMLVAICQAFNENGTGYFADHGTLLGLVRDKCIMPWDDDIDFTVVNGDMRASLNVFQNVLENLPLLKTSDWDVSEFKDTSGRLKKYKIRNVHSPEGFNMFSTTVKTFEIVGEKAVQQFTEAPLRHFSRHDTLVFNSTSIRIPYHTEEYLTHHYGDWKTPNKNINYFDVKNRIETQEQTTYTREN